MQVFSIHYRFSQRFSVSAKKAFDWCTDYQQGDLALMGEEGCRRITKLTNDTVILEERVVQNGRQVRKVKLVKLNRYRNSWHNIHLKGPNRYSEFIYEIISEGRRSSRLIFTGLLLVYSAKPIAQRNLRELADRERVNDSRAWRRLASAMAKELHDNHTISKPRRTGKLR